MRVLLPVLALAASLPALSQTRIDPRIISIHPFTGHPGAIFTATVRGNGLRGATSASLAEAPFTVAVQTVEIEPPSDTGGRNRSPVDLVKLQVSVTAAAKPGRYPIRLLTRNGITNAVPILISEHPVSLEPDGAHDARESAVAIADFPAVFAGRLTRRGEADYYSFHADAGQTLSFAVTSGFPQIASAGSAATVPNFDPALSIYEPEGSWFDPRRLKRIAFNDEPLWVFGRPTDAHLAHRFTKSGTYFLRIEAFAGQGGPDYSYQLTVATGTLPQQVASLPTEWEERTWSRRLDANRLNQLAVRGGQAEKHQSMETWRAASEPVAFKLPGTIEGTLAQPGETHRARFRLDQPADIAIEVQTPAAAPPFFNPIVRLLDGSGTEVATNIFAGRGACSGAMTKSMQAKTIVPLRDTGDYTLEIRDATADLAGPDFAYRVQVRPQVPHIGQVRIDVDHLNLTAGEAKAIRVVFDREEDYRGGIAVVAEALPPGVSAVAGADFEPDKDPPAAIGKRERYTPRTERTVMVLSATATAAPSAEPYDLRLVVRPLVDGRLGDIILTKSIPVMVIEKP